MKSEKLKVKSEKLKLQFVALTILFIAAFSFTTFAQTFQKDFKFKADGAIEITNLYGRVRVEAKEIKEQSFLWDKQVEDLKHAIGA